MSEENTWGRDLAAFVQDARLKQLRYEAQRRRWRIDHPNRPAQNEGKSG